MTENVSSLSETPVPEATTTAPAASRRRPRDGRRTDRTQSATQRPTREIHPVLAQLGQWYPILFSDTVLPLKRGIFQDLLDAHADNVDKAGLKTALAIHTRSTRYLNAVASGAARHDLQGQVVENVAPEHVLHALLEVFKRKKPRDGEDLQAKLRRRIGLAFIASGLTREAYLECLQLRNESALATVDAALAEIAEQDARAEAVQRAYAASGADHVQAFAEMYGMNPRTVQHQLQRAAQLQALRTQPVFKRECSDSSTVVADLTQNPEAMPPSIPQ